MARMAGPVATYSRAAATGQLPWLAASRSRHEQGPLVEGRLTRKRIPRTDDYTQPGQRYLLSEQWEKDDLVANLVANLSQCDRPIQERMVWHFFMCEDELGQRVVGERHLAGQHGELFAAQRRVG